MNRKKEEKRTAQIQKAHTGEKIQHNWNNCMMHLITYAFRWAQGI